MKKVINSLKKPEIYSHKSQNGIILIVGGSKLYHGAPIFSILASRRFVDLVYFHPAQKDDNLVSSVKSIPEAIVVNNLYETCKKADCVLYGVGVEADNKPIGGLPAKDVIFSASKKLVIDGGGLSYILDQIPKNSILTPHEREFQDLFGCKGSKSNVQKMAKKHNCTILKKDPHGDIVSNGKRTGIIKGGNQGLTKGGTGDVLSGLVAAFYSKNPAFESCVAASYVVKKAADSLKKEFKLNFCATDLADRLAKIL